MVGLPTVQMVGCGQGFGSWTIRMVVYVLPYLTFKTFKLTLGVFIKVVDLSFISPINLELAPLDSYNSGYDHFTKMHHLGNRRMSGLRQIIGYPNKSYTNEPYHYRNLKKSSIIFMKVICYLNSLQARKWSSSNTGP
ncbi:hypothetical protein M9H77_17553 [Catharanthus roseus]|uniref:Uncharacterized protein n=1 Tax=Catharanthus roseus TaxID=4058 RepID=A0ACC0B4W3_CATRO|nr:hypothetical protein M9H77_17553 [Catharanthus roseus]